MEEQKLSELIYELKRLVETLGSKPSGSLGSGVDTDKLVRALGMLATKLGNTTTEATAAAKAAENFTKSVNDATAQVRKQEKIDADAAAASKAKKDADIESARVARLSAKEIEEEIKQRAKASREAVIEDARDRKVISEGQARLANTFSDLGISLGKDAKSLGQTFQQASEMGRRLGNTASAIGSFTVGMQNGSKGFTALNPVIDATAAAFSGIPILGGMVKAAAEGTKMLINQLSQTVQAFESVGKVGGLTTEGMSGLQKQFQTSGMTLEAYTSTITANSATMARFAGTVGNGAEIFSKTAGRVQEDFGIGLQKLGFGINEIGETTASYIALQTRLGRAQGKSVSELAVGANKYALELDALAKLTGASKDELKKSQDAALSEARFRAKYDDMVANGQEAQAKAMLDFNTMMKQVSPELAQGYRDSVSGFAGLTDASKKYFLTLGDQGQQALRGLENGSLDITEAMKLAQGGAKDFRKEFNSLIQVTGDSTGAFAAYNQVSDLASKSIGELTSVTIAQATVQAGADPLTDATVQAQRSMQNAMLKLNEIGFDLLPQTAKVVEQFTKIIEKSVKAAGAAVMTEYRAKEKSKDALKTLPGGKKATEADVDNVAAAMESSLGLKIADMITNGLKSFFGSGLAEGGIAKGPASGHLQLLHGTEAVIPLGGGSIPLKILGSGSGIESGPVFNPQTETNFLLEKSNEELVKSNVTLDKILTAITGGATLTGGGGAAAMAQEALAEHDHAHPHEPAAAADPELAKQIGKIVNPLEKMNQTSGFVRNDGKTGHGAIDLAGKIGDKVMAPISGMARVLSEKESGGYGNMVEVTDEKTGVKHMLAHLDKSMVKTGEMIKAGQQIGTLGNTGKSTGAHLHHEMRDKSGKKIDPSQFYTGPGFGSTAGGAATGYPQMVPRGRRGAPGMDAGLGSMSEKYETGGRGSGTVGYDRVGGTSYGKYQIASKVGAMTDFLKFAEQSGRGDVAKKLRDAGAETDTGAAGGKAADVWKQMAAGGELGDLEHQFIKKRSFDPAMSSLKDDDLRKKIEGNKALKEMMWSTSVQHGGGGAAGIMNKVYKKGMSDEDLIKATYAERGTRFGGSTAEVQKGVKNRFVNEEKDVMAMLGMPAGKGVPGAPMVAGAESGPRTTGSLRSALGLPEGGAGASPVASLTQSVMGMLGLGGSTAGQAGITAGGAPGAIGSDISAITQAMEAQTAATQTAITSGMENLTTQLVDKLGGAGGTNDPAVPTLLGEILAAQRDQTTAINKLIQVSTA